jgi:hypothetical protein
MYTVTISRYLKSNDVHCGMLNEKLNKRPGEYSAAELAPVAPVALKLLGAQVWLGATGRRPLQRFPPLTSRRIGMTTIYRNSYVPFCTIF